MHIVYAGERRGGYVRSCPSRLVTMKMMMVMMITDPSKGSTLLSNNPLKLEELGDRRQEAKDDKERRMRKSGYDAKGFRMKMRMRTRIKYFCI